MNYTLAKKLKEAGFPQKRKGINWFDKNGIYHQYDTCCGGWAGEDIPQSAVYIPTLEELIEACEDEFCTLEYLRKNRKDSAYFCFSYSVKEDGYRAEGFGSTPSEAVAHLYLSLNSSKIDDNDKFKTKNNKKVPEM